MVTLNDFVIQSYSILTVIGIIILAVFIIETVFYATAKQTLFSRFWQHIRKNSIKYIFLVSFLSTLGSLIFSDVLGFSPCKLCWFQRILMYPILPLSALAIIKKDRRILPYLFLLALIGAPIAGFHYFNQLAPVSSLPCSAIGYSASCSESFFTTFGFVTIPMMALIAFLLIIMAYVTTRKSF
jgi:disulfide bond formation protein DsbB